MGLFDDLSSALREMGQAAANAQAARRAAWYQLAEALGASFDGSTSHGIYFEHDGIAGRVRTRTTSRRNSNGSTRTSTKTLFYATYALGAGPRFTVTRDGGGQWFRDFFGVEDRLLGDDAFDRAFVVQTPDIEWTRQAWTEEAKQRRSYDPHGSLSADGRQVYLRLSGRVYAPERLLNGAAMVIELARVNSGWIERLRDLVGADARITPAHGPYDQRVPPSIHVSPSSAVAVAPIPYLNSLGVVAYCPPARELPFFDTGFRDGHTERALREDVLEGRAPQLLRAVGAGRLFFEGAQIQVHVAPPIDGDRLRAACDLAERIAVGGAAPPTSAYR